MKYTVKVGCLHTDNGDGSKTCYMFPSYKEAYESKLQSMKDTMPNQEFSKEDVENDYGYENGYLSEDEFEIEIVGGKARLTQAISLYDGSQ